MMILLSQLIDRCKQSYRGQKVHKKEMKKVQVSVVFSCQKMKILIFSSYYGW